MGNQEIGEKVRKRRLGKSKEKFAKKSRKIRENLSNFSKLVLKPSKNNFGTSIEGLPGLGGSLGAFERSSDFAITELSSPPNGDSRLTRLKFSMEDFFLPLLSASWIKLEIFEDGGR